MTRHPSRNIDRHMHQSVLSITGSSTRGVMRFVRGPIVGLMCLVGLVLIRPSMSCAETEHTQADIKLLQDAASALQQSRPDLANALKNYAERERKELEDMTTEQHEKEDMGDTPNPQDEQNEHTAY